VAGTAEAFIEGRACRACAVAQDTRRDARGSSLEAPPPCARRAHAPCGASDADGQLENRIEGSVAYFDALRAPSKKLLWFEASGHEPFVDEAEKFNEAMIDLVRPILKTHSPPARAA
jgi:hypothetical protein